MTNVKGWKWLIPSLFILMTTMPRAAEETTGALGGMLEGMVLGYNAQEIILGENGSMSVVSTGDVVMKSSSIDLLCERLEYSTDLSEMKADGTSAKQVQVSMRQDAGNVEASCNKLTLKMDESTDGTTIVLTGNPIIKRGPFTQEGDLITIIKKGDTTTIRVVMLTNRRGVLKTGDSALSQNTTNTTSTTSTQDTVATQPEKASASGMSLGGGMLDKMTCTFTGKQEVTSNDATGEIDLQITGDVILRSEKVDLDCDVLTYSSKTGKMLALGSGSKRAYAKMPMAQGEYVEAWCQQMELTTNPNNQEETKIIMTGKPEIKRGAFRQSGGRIVIDQKDGRTTITTDSPKGGRGQMETGGGASVVIPESDLPGSKTKPASSGKKATPKPTEKKATPKPVPTAKKPPII